MKEQPGIYCEFLENIFKDLQLKRLKSSKVHKSECKNMLKNHLDSVFLGSGQLFEYLHE